jgi:hypothetical protein
MSNVLAFLAGISTVSKQATSDLEALASAEKAANAAKATGSGSNKGGPSVTTTARAVGPGFAADAISALKSLGGR